VNRNFFLLCLSSTHSTHNRMKNKRIAFKIFAAGLIASTSLLGACTPIQNVRGQLVTAQERAQIIPGETTQNQVLAMLGSPSTVSEFSEHLWMYIGKKTEAYAFFKPEIIDQKVFLVEFNTENVVVDTALLDQRHIQSVRIDPDATPTAGRNLTIIQQLVGNIGRFSGRK